MRFIAISGSLRAASSNTRIVHALGRLTPKGVEIEVYGGLGDLPHFNPDLDGGTLPESVLDLRRLIGVADGLVICSPEYAHGVAGSMKNALDWLVPSLEFPQTPVCLINAAPRAHHAHNQMLEILTMMSARIVEAACVGVSLQGRPLSSAEIAQDPELGGILSGALETFVAAISEMEPSAF